MAEKDNGLNWFWITMIGLISALIIFGVFVTWRILRSAAPNVEKSYQDPDRILEQTSISDKTTTTVAAPTEQKTLLVQDIDIENWNQLGKDLNEEEENEYMDEEYDSFEETEQADQETTLIQEEAPKQSANPVENFSYTLADVSDGAPTPTPKKNTLAKPKPAPKTQNILFEKDLSYQEGLTKCRQDNIFPCKWRDTRQELKKQYRLNNVFGPVERITYTKAGHVLTRTLATMDETVMYYQGAFAELYFTDGILMRIRTFPYDNPNLRDWFVIDSTGRLSTCLCGMPTKDCCSRSMLYREGGHRKYCELFPLDTDFCTK